jgi:hypothetical protein
MKKLLVKDFDYNGNRITFKTEEGEVYVNATQMGKPFGKKPAKWLELPATISFLETLSSVRKSDTSDYQTIIRKMGSPASGGGTWFHEDVALEYARWLSEEFKIWCNDKIKILMKTELICNSSSGFISSY